MNFAQRIKARWRQYSLQERIVIPLVYVFLLVMAFKVLLPIFYVLMNSLKAVREFNDSAVAFPKTLEWANYARAIVLEYRNTNVVGMFFNSIFYTVSYSVANTFSSCMAAYILSKYHFKARGFIYSLAIAVQLIPIFGNAGASFRLVSDLGLINHMSLMWITALGGFDYTFLIVYSYFQNVSWTYAEAAFIDGASNWYTFTRIMLPMVLPAILTMWLSNVIALWSDFSTPMIYLQDTPTLASGLYNMKSRAPFVEGGITTYFAALIISIIPIVALYTVLQKQLLDVNVDGGIKG